MPSRYPPGILFYSLPDGTITPLIGSDGRFVPIRTFTGAAPGSRASFGEPVVVYTIRTTTYDAGRPLAAYVLLIVYRQADGSYAPSPDA